MTTDVAALPEINDEKQGWVIHVPKDGLGKGLWRGEEARATFSRLIEEQLHAHLSAILADPSVIRRKGAIALQRIREHHSPESRAAVLEGIYASARKRR